MKLGAAPIQDRLLRIGFGLLALVAVWAAIQRPPNEPSYQGRTLSEWMERHNATAYSFPNSPEAVEARQAIRAIGTNALPILLKWISYKRHTWQTTAHDKLPSWLKNNQTVYRWLGPEADQRAENGFIGIILLDTNVVYALPDLEAMLKHRTNPWIVYRATIALTFVGQPAIPILQAALADPHQFNRTAIVAGLELIAEYGYLSNYLRNEKHSVRGVAIALLRVSQKPVPDPTD